MVRVAPINLTFNPRTLWFDPGDLDIEKDMPVVVRTARGTEFGIAASEVIEVSEEQVRALKSALRPVERIATEEDLAKSDVILVGPGMGTSDDSERFLEALSQDRPMVFDADALTLIARNHGLLDMPARHPRILTPHEGEAARLLGRKIANRNEDALQLARDYEATVVLKGPETLVATPLGELRAVVEGGPELAKAGTGDVLGGMVASFLAQGLDALDAATLAVSVHGRAGRAAARELSVHAVMPEDIICKIGSVLLDLEAEDNS